jgi:hypothetical protein
VSIFGRRTRTQYAIYGFMSESEKGLLSIVIFSLVNLVTNGSLSFCTDTSQFRLTVVPLINFEIQYL